MNRRYAAVGVVVALLLAAGLGAALYTGVGPAPGGGSGEEIDDFPTGTEYDGDSGGDGSGDGGDADEPRFTFAVDEIEECGSTCRDVTATVTETDDETASNVTVYTRIFAGENTTDEEDLVWEGKTEIGTLEAGGSHTSTERVELSIQEARQIDREDGWITIVTTVESDEETITFTDSEQVG